MFKFKLFSIKLGKARRLAGSATNMFAKAHSKLGKAIDILNKDRQTAIEHAEELQRQIREAELVMDSHKKAQDKLKEFFE
jgi:hypothetical protein